MENEKKKKKDRNRATPYPTHPPPDPATFLKEGLKIHRRKIERKLAASTSSASGTVSSSSSGLTQEPFPPPPPLSVARDFLDPATSPEAMLHRRRDQIAEKKAKAVTATASATMTSSSGLTQELLSASLEDVYHSQQKKSLDSDADTALLLERSKRRHEEDTQPPTHEPRKKKNRVLESPPLSQSEQDEYWGRVLEQRNEEKLPECQDVKNPVKTKKTSRFTENEKISRKDSEWVDGYKCPKCDKSFEKPVTFCNHYWTDHYSPSNVVYKEKGRHCPFCGNYFGRKDRVYKHIATYHSKKKILRSETEESKIVRNFQCHLCQEAFIQPMQMVNHYSQKHPREDTEKQNSNGEIIHGIQCPVCNKVVQNKDGLRNHMTLQHIRAELYIFKCPNCSMSFPKEYLLKNHLQITHSEERPFNCSFCSKTFKRNCDLKRHEESHFNEKNYTCQTCGKAFHTHDDLRNHQITHREVKPFTCEICKKGFNRSRELREHKLLHSEEKTYQCSVCDEMFQTKTQMQRHMAIHTQRFKCQLCGRLFTTNPGLRSHILYVHEKPNERPFKCSNCSRSYKTNSDLTKHQKSYCAEIYPCPHCENVCFTNKGNLTSHVKIHEKKQCTCKICGRLCENAYYLHKHIKTHEEKRSRNYPFPCKFCSLRFLRNDLRDLHEYLGHFKHWKPCTSRNGKLKYVLYWILLVETEHFSSGHGDEIWKELCRNPGKYNIKWYVGVHSSCTSVVARPGHTMPSSRRSSAVYKQHLKDKGWRCFYVAKEMTSYAEMRREEALIIKWAKQKNSKSQQCINTKIEPLPRQEEHHVREMLNSGLNFFCFDETHPGNFHQIQPAGVPLGQHFRPAAMKEMRFNGCTCQTCERDYQRIEDFYDTNEICPGEEDEIAEVGVLYEEPLDPEMYEDDDGDEETDNVEVETEMEVEYC